MCKIKVRKFPFNISWCFGIMEEKPWGADSAPPPPPGMGRVDSGGSQKRKNPLQINVRINHPESAFILVSKDVGGEAFVLLEKQIEYCLEMLSIYVTSFFV